MNTSKVDKISKIASSWWTSVINNPRFDNGEINYIISILHSKTIKKYNPYELNLFKDALYTLICNKLKNLDDFQYYWLDVDYNPCKDLKQCAEVANITETNFPIKTTMCISNHHIFVKYGYSDTGTYLYMDKFYIENKINEYDKNISDKIKKAEDDFGLFDKKTIINELTKELKYWKNKLDNFEGDE